jgi:hypothetical protein
VIAIVYLIYDSPKRHVLSQNALGCRRILAKPGSMDLGMSEKRRHVRKHTNCAS